MRQQSKFVCMREWIIFVCMCYSGAGNEEDDSTYYWDFEPTADQSSTEQSQNVNYFRCKIAHYSHGIFDIQGNRVFSLENVLLELEELVNWRDMVLHLRVPRRVVDRIEKDYTGIERQKREAISWWMENNDAASWKELADALLQADYPLLSTRVMLNQGTRVNIWWWFG